MTARLSVVVPTYGRDRVLVATIDHLAGLEPAAREILVVDQTPRHDPETQEQLEEYDRLGTIRWLRLEKPSIPHAMNVGLMNARGDRVLFVDDDIVPDDHLVGAHGDAGAESCSVIVAGQVLQPEESPAELQGAAFGFRSSVAQSIEQVMGGNFSVDRGFALGIGGFDESFVGAAYCFEADFCRRALAEGASILFDPRASIRHLRASRGGTREYGSHLQTHRPYHSVGEYYYQLRHRPNGWLRAILRRPLRSITTRFHLRRPWWVPVTLVAELSGLLLALRLSLSKPRLVAMRPGTTEPRRGLPTSPGEASSG